MKIHGQEIKASEIVSLNPDRQSVLLKTKNLLLNELSDFTMNGMIRVKVTESEFQMAKFEYIRQLKMKPRPEDRVDPFLECLADDGGIDFNRLEELIEQRKTPQEIQKELDEEVALFLKFKERKIPYYGTLKIQA
jgi:hypothetical protein